MGQQFFLWILGIGRTLFFFALSSLLWSQTVSESERRWQRSWKVHILFPSACFCCCFLYPNPNTQRREFFFKNKICYMWSKTLVYGFKLWFFHQTRGFMCRLNIRGRRQFDNMGDLHCCLLFACQCDSTTIHSCFWLKTDAQELHWWCN